MFAQNGQRLPRTIFIPIKVEQDPQAITHKPLAVGLIYTQTGRVQRDHTQSRGNPMKPASPFASQYSSTPALAHQLFPAD